MSFSATRPITIPGPVYPSWTEICDQLVDDKAMPQQSVFIPGVFNSPHDEAYFRAHAAAERNAPDAEAFFRALAAVKKNDLLVDLKFDDPLPYLQ
jgi:hypothetical protein